MAIMLESTCSACRIINYMNKQERNVFLFLLGARSFSSKDRASLLVLLAKVSVGIVSSSAPFALEVEGLQEAVELVSEVELLEPEHAAILQLLVESRG